MGLALYREDGPHGPEDYAQWSYTGFNYFRTKIAAAVDIDLDAMDGFGGSVPWSDVESPLVPLLHHADDDGVLTAEECATVWPELDRVVREVFAPTPESYDNPLDHDLAHGLALVAMMRRAAENDQRILFR
jgi:hypothetical protein